MSECAWSVSKLGGIEMLCARKVCSAESDRAKEHMRVCHLFIQAIHIAKARFLHKAIVGLLDRKCLFLRQPSRWPRCPLRRHHLSLNCGALAYALQDPRAARRSMVQLKRIVLHALHTRNCASVRQVSLRVASQRHERLWPSVSPLPNR